ncbi:MAG TPA: hypothetical protein VMS02_06925 [Solirubrobacteraceae bacterium]|nr:hypothetical protein [Solirubrobacteraceae bacterium]
MAQLSRPFQVALGACVLFALLWFALLHRPGSAASTSSGGSASAAASSTPAHVTGGTRASGPATRAGGHVRSTTGDPRSRTGGAHVKVAAGHSAATAHPTAAHPATARRTAAATAHPAAAHPTAVHSATARPTATRHSSAAAPAARRHTATSTHRPAVATRPMATRHPSGGSPSPAAGSGSTPAMQAAVAAELKQGKTVLVLFWNPHASDDVAVHSQVQAVAHKLGRRVAVHAALADQVGSFGSITRDIQLYQTPTLLIVNSHAQVTTLTGYTEAFAIEQAIAEARG